MTVGLALRANPRAPFSAHAITVVRTSATVNADSYGSLGSGSACYAIMHRVPASEHLRILEQDLRHAGRSLRRTPIITAAAVLTLMFGVGATTAVFSLVHAVLLRPLPYPEPDRLVEFFEENLKDRSMFRVSALNYRSWAERAQSFEAKCSSAGSAPATTAVWRLPTDCP